MDTISEKQRKDPIFKNHNEMKVWQLRHMKVSELITKLQIKRIIDFGCSEGELMLRLSRSYNIEFFAGIDIDDQAINKAKQKMVPELVQNQIQFYRENNQVLYLFKGDISKPSKILKDFNTELITLVEVIEHLHQSLITKSVFNIFGYLRPKYVFISTPNKDFNVFLPLRENEFRHSDHKFEWTQKEFIEFCKSIENTYGYTYQIDGAGEHNSDTSKGFCTQIAFFTLNMELQHQQPQLIKQTTNLSWKNKLIESIRQTLAGKQKIRWSQAIDRIKKDEIGKQMLKNNQNINKTLLKSIISESNDIRTYKQGICWN